jgi:hypothetical protein
MRPTATVSVLSAALVAGLGVTLSGHTTPTGATVTTLSAGATSSPAAEPRMRDITRRVDRRRRGLGAFADTWGDSLVFRKNRDRHPDVLLTFHVQPWEIWLGTERGRFTFDRALPRTDRHNCATADFAGPGRTPPDGRADLYCVRGANRGTLSDKENQLLIQRAGGGFRNVATRWGVADPSGRGRTVSILDIRGDGRPSLFVGNAEPEEHPSRDHIFVNKGRRFTEAHTGGLPSVQGTRCSDTGDFDRDGRQDFLSCSASLRLYENRTEPQAAVSYAEVAADQGLPDNPWRDAELVDLNSDGWRDLVLVSNSALEVRLNTQETPHFSQVDYSHPLVAGASVCSGRANSDAAPDLLVVQKLESNSDLIQKRDWMLVNSGTGTEFEALPVPQPPMRNGRNGNGDTCSAIPDYRGERAAWTISNGRMTAVPTETRPGYRQLVMLARQP